MGGAWRRRRRFFFKGLGVPDHDRKLGTQIAGLIPPDDRTEEPEFEVFDPLSEPPDFR